MFHTFELCRSNSQPEPPEGEKPPQNASVAYDRRACEECCRRKTRCDRLQPCGSCIYYRKPHLCRYKEKKPSSRKLSVIGLQYRAILKRLFPSRQLESLYHLTREQLVNLVLFDQRASSSTICSLASEPASTSHTPVEADRDIYGDERCLEILESIPDSEPDQTIQEDLMKGVSDDVNSLSPVAQPPCYLGVSSISAVMKVMISIDPSSISYLSSLPTPKTQLSHERQLQVGADFDDPHHESHSPSTPSLDVLSAVIVQEVGPLTFNAGLELVDAFFTNVHPLATILDEVQFRALYQAGNRCDSRWRALLNTVFALGSISIRPTDDNSHNIYFQRSKAVLDLGYFAQPHIESIQTLGLIAGYYLHFVSQPHLAYSLMGVAIRMAASLGLHKEPFGLSGSSTDLRRRVWWSLFCMDTFACMTLGRPTFGRSGPSINIKLPEMCGNDRSLAAVNLVESTRFCMIATQIQEALATSPRIPSDQISELDSKLVEWYEQLPSLLTSPQEAHTAAISTTQTNIQWRYLNCRMLLYRPALLDYAMRLKPFSSLSSGERHAISQCRLIARATIKYIAEASNTSPTAAWGSAWYIFQAALVPLLVLFVQDETLPFDHELEQDARILCQEEVNITLSTLLRLADSTPTARHTAKLVSRILNACQRKQGKTSTGEESAFMPPSTGSESNRSPLGSSTCWGTLPYPFAPIRINSHAQNPTALLEDYPRPTVCTQLDASTGTLNSLTDQDVWEYIAWGRDNPWIVPHSDAEISADSTWPWVGIVGSGP